MTDALEELRTMAHQMYPRILDDLGLGAALERLASRAEDASPATVHFEHDDPGAPVPPMIAAVLYRVAQEALGNALTHSGASTVLLRVATGARWRYGSSRHRLLHGLRASTPRRPGVRAVPDRPRVLTCG